MFEVDVKNAMEERRGGGEEGRGGGDGRSGPAWVWGSDKSNHNGFSWGGDS